MKARARNPVDREQKGFFKRKKLDMLAKGLFGSLEPVMQSSRHSVTRVGPGDIELAHARFKKTKDQIDAGSPIRTRSPIQVSSNRFPSKKRRRIGDAHTYSPDLGKSDILNNLDTSEREY